MPCGQRSRQLWTALPRGHLAVRHRRHGRRMTAPHEPYPLRRSFLEERLGHAVGLVQFSAAELAERVSASTLAGIVVTASEAPIGTLEFDGLTVLARDFAHHGNHASLELKFSVGGLCRSLGMGDGTWQRRDVVIALARLNRVVLTLPEVDDNGLEIGARERHLFQELAISADSHTLRTVAGQHDLRLQEIAQGDDARGTIVFTRWLAEAILQREGRTLDLDTQRRLAGVAKTVWVTLEVLPYTELADENLEVHMLDLTDRVYEALRLRSRRRTDNCKTLRAALARIQEADPTFKRLEVVEHPLDRQHRQLVIERYTGEERQHRLRHRELSRLDRPRIEDLDEAA